MDMHKLKPAEGGLSGQHCGTLLMLIDDIHCPNFAVLPLPLSLLLLPSLYLLSSSHPYPASFLFQELFCSNSCQYHTTSCGGRGRHGVSF